MSRAVFICDWWRLIWWTVSIVPTVLIMAGNLMRRVAAVIAVIWSTTSVSLARYHVLRVRLRCQCPLICGIVCMTGAAAHVEISEKLDWQPPPRLAVRTVYGMPLS